MVFHFACRSPFERINRHHALDQPFERPRVAGIPPPPIPRPPPLPYHPPLPKNPNPLQPPNPLCVEKRGPAIHSKTEPAGRERMRKHARQPQPFRPLLPPLRLSWGSAQAPHRGQTAVGNDAGLIRSAVLPGAKLRDELILI